MSGEAERPVLEVMRQIKAGSLDPRRLEVGERQACVTHLWGEGLSVAEIAQILKRSERTVARDRKVIQRANALTHDPEFAGEVGGRLLSEAELSIGRIRRVTRSPDTPPAVRVEGERACFAIWVALCQRLQSLGYLPNATQKIEAQLTYHSAEPPAYEEIQSELARIKQVTSRDPESARQLSDLEDRLTRARLGDQVAEAGEALDREDTHNASP